MNRKLFFIFNLVIAFIFIAITITLVLIESYFLGNPILSAGNVLGGDSGYHLSWIHVLNRFWPKIPLWFPYAGAGSSIVFGYWVIPYYIVIYVSHASSLTIEQAIRVVQFLTVPIVAFELYLFGWLRLKNHVIGLIAAFLYPLSSLSWGWISNAGFLSMHVSLAMVIPALIFYDAFLEQVIRKNSSKFYSRFFLLGAGIFIGGTILFHLASGASLLIGLPIYTLGRGLLAKTNKLKHLFYGAIAYIIAVITGLSFAAFLLYPQKRYFSLQALDFTPYYSVQDFPTLPWKAFLGFEQLINVGSLHTALFISKIVTIFAILGLIFALAYRSKVAALGLLALFYIFIISNGKFLLANYPFLNPILFPTNVRSVGITGAIFPLLAAYGIWSIADVPGRITRRLTKNFKANSKYVIKAFFYILASIIAISLILFAVYKNRTLQEYELVIDDTKTVVEGYQGYGMMGAGNVVPLCVVPGWEKVNVPLGKTCKDIAPSLNKIEIGKGGKDFLTASNFDQDAKNLDLSSNTRVAISPLLGGFMQSYNSHGNSSMVNSPSGQSMLNLSYFGIQTQVLFDEKSLVIHDEVSEMAKWFGIKYVFLNEDSEKKEVINRYQSKDWKTSALINNNINVKEFKNNPGVAVISNKPAALVIGTQKKKAYEIVFRAAIRGVLPYDKTILIQGKEKIDDYSLSELQKYKLIILSGYSYNSKSKAWGLLKTYVENGGNLFVDTGWQYVSKDWGISKEGSGVDTKYFTVFSDPFPISRTTWGDTGKSFEGFNLDQEIAGEVKITDLEDLKWAELPWGLSYAKRDGLKSWAKPLLFNENKVIIAYGNFGSGKVVWSGMNIFAHAYSKKTSGEYKLLQNIFSYLIENKDIIEEKVIVDREFPDRVELLTENFSDERWLYWAETYTPDWKAYLEENGNKTYLKVFKSGPGFQAVLLPKTSGNPKIVLEYDLKKVLLFSFGITILAFLLIFISIFDAVLLKGKIEQKIKEKIFNKYEKLKKRTVSNKISKVKSILEDEEDY